MLSIIIPIYNAEPYIGELIETLKPQINNQVEVIAIDDGSTDPYKAPYEWVKVYRQRNKGLAAARNAGLKKAKGDIIAFIDADDLVADDYIKYILSRAEESWDYMDLSWRSLENNKYMFLLKNDQDRLANPSACTRIFKRNFIGKLKFNEKKDVAEDEDFTRRLGLDKGKRACATKYLYFYRTETPDSLSKKYRDGRTTTKRIVYYFQEIKENDHFLLEEIKRDSKENEIVILTNRNALPELSQYAAIYKPQQTWAHEARGAANNYIKLRRAAMKTQVVIYTAQTFNIGGIESFIYNFCRIMAKHYDILVLYKTANASQLARLKQIVRVEQEKGQPIECDTLIINRIHDSIPQNIKAKKTIQMVHGCKEAGIKRLPEDKGKLIFVSETAKDSFGEEAAGATVIKNMVETRETQNPLLLVSATRLDTEEKGQDRMRTLANLMHKQGVPFLWLYFSNRELKEAPAGVVKMEPTLNIREYIKKADYLIQLSDTEAFCYSIAEALAEGTPVITTPLPVLKELGVKEGKNAHIVPFDLEGVDTTKFYNIPEFSGAAYNNGLIVSKWKKVLGNTKPTGSYKPEPQKIVEIINQYKDIELGRVVTAGELIPMPDKRAEEVQAAGFGVIRG